MQKAFYPLVFVWCLGAQCNQAPQVRKWSEHRVDSLGDDRIDSHDTKMCVAPNGNAYVLWIDDRSGVSNLYLNRKLAGDDRNVGWLPADVQVNRFSDSNIWNPDLACTDSTVYVVWEDDRDGEVESHQVYFQRSTNNGETWLPEDRLLEDDEEGRTNSFNPDIVADGPNVYVAWSDNQSGAFDILFTRSPDSGNTFPEGPIRIDSDPTPGGAFSAFPRISTGFGGDNVYIVWEDFRNGGATQDGGSDIYFSRSTTKGQSFESDVRIDTGDEPGTANSFVPKIDADDNDIYIVWHDDRFGTSNDAMMAYSPAGGESNSWTPASPADQADNRGVNQSLYPKVCVSGSTGHVVWHDNRLQGFYRVFYNRANAGLWDGTEERLDENKLEGQRASRDTRIACDGQNLLVSWLDYTADETDAGFNDIVYDFSADGGSTWLDWELAEDKRESYRLDSVEEGTAFKKDVTIHLKGNLVQAAWTDGRAGSTDIYYQQLKAGEAEPLVRIVE